MLPVTSKSDRHLGVGIVGLGDRGCFVLGARINELERETGLSIRALCDTNPARLHDAASFLAAGAAGERKPQDFHLYHDFRDLIADPAVDFILITNHTYAHREPTVAALRSGKRVYLDKPIAVTLEDALEIVATERATGNRVIMGFTRRYEATWQHAYRLLQDGAIGDLQMMQIRSVIPYTRYLQMWHRELRFSGGALNDKSSHHMDAFTWFAGSHCETVIAMGGRSGIFAPDPSAPPYCAVCDRVCPYRRQAGSAWNKEGSQVLDYRSWAEAEGVLDRADTCVYLPGSDIEDHVIATYRYANGVVANLFWTIFGPAADDQETLELVGSRGRLLMTRSTGTIDLIGDFGRRRRTIDARGSDFSSSHYGADLELVRTLRRFADGGVAPAGAVDGLSSLRMIEATRASLRADGQPQFLTAHSEVAQ